MSDFMLVVDQFFSICNAAFNVISGNFILSLAFIVSIISIIVNLVLVVKGTK